MKSTLGLRRHYNSQMGVDGCFGDISSLAPFVLLPLGTQSSGTCYLSNAVGQSMHPMNSAFFQTLITYAQTSPE